MGTWGSKAWENDTAADWFGDTWDACALPEIIDEALKLDVREYPEEVRAATFVVIQLAQTFVWPVEKIDEHVKLAHKQLKQLVRSGIHRDSKGITAQVNKEIAKLSKLMRPKPKR